MRRIESREDEGGHSWVVMTCTTSLEDTADPFVARTVASLREAYGESDLIAMALEPDPAVAASFSMDAILKAFSRGLPEPAREGNKPAHMANYRSEATEIVARDALREAHTIEFPVSPQRGKGNANQPVLGFDGWGFLRRPDNTYALVLVQVKSTDQKKSPPDEADTLAKECKQVPTDIDTLCRAMSVIALFLKGTEYQNVAMAMMDALGNDRLPPIVVGPVIVRGVGAAHINDLAPVRAVMPEVAPTLGRGVTVSLGCVLAEFGRKVMDRARTAA